MAYFPAQSNFSAQSPGRGNPNPSSPFGRRDTSQGYSFSAYGPLPFRPHPRSTSAMTDSQASTVANQPGMHGPTFASSDDCFYGTPMESARRWLKLITRKYGKTPAGVDKSAADILAEIDERLRGVAASWADTNPIVKRILDEDNAANITAASLADFKEQFLQKFKPIETDDVEPYQEIENLCQSEGQTLADYYNQSAMLLKQLDADDDASTDNKMAKALLKMVVTKFVQGLSDPVLQARMVGYPYSSDCTLRGAYSRAQTEIQRIQAQQDMVEKNRQAMELSLLQEMRSYLVQGRPVPAHLTRELQGFDGTNSSVHTMPTQGPLNQPGGAIPLPQGNNNTQTGGHVQVSGHQPTYVQPTVVVTQPQVEPGRSNMANRPPPPIDNTYDYSRSSCAVVRGDEEYRYIYNNPLCYKCGTRGHMGRECTNNQMLPRQERDFLLNAMYVSRQQAQALREARQQAVATGANAEPIGVRAAESHFTEVQLLGGDDDDLDEWEEIIPEMEVDVFDSKAKRTAAGANITDPDDREPQRPRLDGNGSQPGTDGHESPKGDGEKKGKKKRKPRKSANEPQAPPPPIRAKVGSPPLNILGMLTGANITLPFVDMAAVSPWFRNEVKRVIQVPRKPRKTKAKGRAVEEIIDSNYVGAVSASKLPSLGADVLDSIEAWKTKGPSRAFGVNVKIWHPNGGQKMSVSRDMVLADQGSDITIIYPPLPKLLNLKVYPVSNLLESNTKLIMNTAGVGSVQLTEWTHFKLSVAGVEREVWAFVSPSHRQNLSILLGIPFLSSVNAKLHIRDETIELGDAAKSEDVVLLKAPPKDSTRAKLQIKQDTNHIAQQESDGEKDSEETSEDEDEDSEDSESEIEEGSTTSETDSPDYEDGDLEEVFQ